MTDPASTNSPTAFSGEQHGRSAVRRKRWLRARAELLDRQRWRLLTLSVVAGGLWLCTGAVARVEREWHRSDARTLVENGDRSLRAGNGAAAVRALRQAVTLERRDVTYGLALASALTETGAAADAERELQRLRRSEPGSPRVSVALARLLGARGSVPLAVQSYDEALQGPWASGEARQDVRAELIEMLVHDGQDTRALAETLILAANSPESAAAQARLGRLYLAAGDPTRAADAYRRVVASDADDAAARAGLGTALFQMGDYAAARRQLAGVSPTDPVVHELRELSERILSGDPLETTSRQQRRQRLATLAAHALMRADLCIDLAFSTTPVPEVSQLEVLRDAIEPPRGVPRSEREVVEHVVAVAAQIEALSAACGPLDIQGRATVLIAKRHASSPAP